MMVRPDEADRRAPEGGEADASCCTDAAAKFNQIDSYVWRRLKRFMVRRKGRNLRAGEALRWTRDFFQSHGLHRLRGTVKYPEAA